LTVRPTSTREIRRGSRATSTTERIQISTTPDAERVVHELASTAVMLIELKYRPATCDSAFCRPIPYVSVRIGRNAPEERFVKTLSAGVDIFLQEPLARLAIERKAQIEVDTVGFWTWKRLRVGGLDPYLL